MEAKKKRSVSGYRIEKSGNLYARFQCSDKTDNKNDEYKTITDKQTARSTAERMRQEAKLCGTGIVESGKMVFSELAEKYEAARLSGAQYQNGVKVSGRRSLPHLRATIMVLKRYFGSCPLQSIKVGDIEAYKQERLRTPVEIVHKIKIENPAAKSRKKFEFRREVKTRPRRIASINRELELLQTMLNFAVENDWLAGNLFSKRKGLITKAAKAERRRVFGIDEEEKLLAFCVEQRAHLKPVIICALDTAMRRGEIFEMRRRDIDFEKMEIHIPNCNTGTRVKRVVRMTPRLKNELVKMLEAEFPQESFRLQDPVFGKASTVKTAWEALLEKAGIKDFRFHDCRHTAVTRMIASGSPLTEVMKITGHTHLKTFSRYFDITPRAAQSVARRLLGYQKESTLKSGNPAKQNS